MFRYHHIQESVASWLRAHPEESLRCEPITALSGVGNPLSETILQNPVTVLRGVGEKLTLRLSEIGIHSLEDLLFHFPLRYQDRTHTTPIGGALDQHDAVIKGEVLAAAVTMGRRRTLVVKVEDTTGVLTVRFFHFRQSQVAQFRQGGTNTGLRNRESGSLAR